MPSASSSPDDHQCCPHFDSAINADVCCVCGTREALDAAEPEAPTAAQEAAMDELTHLRQEMEATEPEAPEGPGPTELAPCAICGDRRKTNEFKAGLLLCEPCIYSEGQPYCGACGSKEAPFGLVSHEGEDRFNELRCAKCLLPPRRPPYAVAYATEGGAQYEIALPGDATIRAEGGALIITHASAVLALTMARPMEN
jgi:hypothetical protein